MRIVLNDFIGVRGRSGSSRGAALIAAAISAEGALVDTIRPRGEPRTKVLRLLNMILWDFVRIPFRSSRLNADIVIHATNTGISFGKAKSVVVLHDTMVLDHPRMFNRYFVMYATVCMWASVRKSWLVVTPSEHSERRIKSRWPKAQVRVVPWPSYSEEGIAQSVEGLPSSPLSQTVLVVSSVDQHKRLPLAVEAVRAARVQSGKDLKLVFVTRPGNDDAQFRASVASSDPERQWISLHSGVEDEALTLLYRQALCVLVSSVDEGFCLPALEASANGVPVVHTNRGALPEVIPRSHLPSSDLADDGDLLSKQIIELLDDETWRKYRDADRLHSAKFSKSNFTEKWASVLRESEKN
ncbi:glycosyltransferase [Arthrobacter sp. NicSoilB8]|uniref:glycosyltransferase n=1 Tax=Arthrobacter sp. NicSoilB8 TaxID=2830998 RepID=UPI001CC5F0E2|nr:glycosyltransferase [Arthrobacter sp. NicSoilB8]